MINFQEFKKTVAFAVVVALVVLGVQFVVGKVKHSAQVSYGAVGGLLIENYDPYVMSNGGINSALPFQTSSTLTVAGITNSGTSSTTGQANFIGGIRVGSNGNVLSEIVDNLCYIFPYAAGIPATTTKIVDCQANSAAGTAGAIAPLVGVQANDFVQVNLSTTTVGSTVGGLVLAGASASTTSGYITLKILNMTGADFVWPTTGNATGTATFHDSNR